MNVKQAHDPNNSGLVKNGNIRDKANIEKKTIEKVAHLCEMAYKATEVVSDLATEDEINNWLKSTWRKIVALPKILPSQWGATTEIPDMLSSLGTAMPDKLVQLVVWSCFTKDCHNSILTSLRSEIGDVDPDTVISLLNLYIMCTQYILPLV